LGDRKDVWPTKIPCCPPRHKIGHFGDVLSSHVLGLVLKKTKPNTTKANNTRTKMAVIKTSRKIIQKANLKVNLNQQLTVEQF